MSIEFRAIFSAHQIQKILKTLSLVLVMCISQGTLANGQIVLHPKDEKESEIKVPLDVAKMIGTVDSFLKDFGETENIKIPIDKTDFGTLKAVVNFLTDHKENPSLDSEMKRLLEKSIVKAIGNISPDAILRLIISANFLDIPMLLQPAAELWIDKKIGERSEELDMRKISLELIDELEKNVLTKELPKVLLPLFEKYLKEKWVPKVSITPLYLIHSKAKHLAIASGKLFAAHSSVEGHMVSVINLEDDYAIRHIKMEVSTDSLIAYMDQVFAIGRSHSRRHDEIGIINPQNYSTRTIDVPYVESVAFADHYLYVLADVSSNRKIFVVDLEQDEKLAKPLMTIPKNTKISLLQADKEMIYAVGHELETRQFFKINPKTKRVEKALLLEKTLPFLEGDTIKLFIAANKTFLMVGQNENYKLLTINQATSQVLGEPLKLQVEKTQGRKKYTFVDDGEYLYVSIGQMRDSKIFVIDMTTNRLIDTIDHPSSIVDMAVYNNKLYVADDEGQTISVLKIKKSGILASASEVREVK